MNNNNELNKQIIEPNSSNNENNEQLIKRNNIILQNM